MITTIKNTVEHVVSLIKQGASKHKISKLLNKNEEIFLEVGAGNKKGKDGWLTIDIEKDCDIYWDLRNGMPFPDESITQIYSSHFMEHLTYKEGQAFLDECSRVLVSGGIFSICVPNARKYIEAYMNNSDLNESQYLNYGPAFHGTTKIDIERS